MLRLEAPDYAASSALEALGQNETEVPRGIIKLSA